MLKWVALVATVVACGSRDAGPDWKVRTGPGFEVTAPFPAIVGKRPMIPGVAMETYDYNRGGASMVVTVLPRPADLAAADAIKKLRDRVGSTVTITHEDDIELGDATGKDVRFTGTDPSVGPVIARFRFVVRKDHIYQVASMWGPSVEPKGADRFIESFRLTD